MMMDRTVLERRKRLAAGVGAVVCVLCLVWYQRLSSHLQTIEVAPLVVLQQIAGYEATWLVVVGCAEWMDEHAVSVLVSRHALAEIGVSLEGLGEWVGCKALMKMVASRPRRLRAATLGQFRDTSRAQIRGWLWGASQYDDTRVIIAHGVKQATLEHMLSMPQSLGAIVQWPDPDIFFEHSQRHSGRMVAFHLLDATISGIRDSDEMTFPCLKDALRDHIHRLKPNECVQDRVLHLGHTKDGQIGYRVFNDTRGTIDLNSIHTSVCRPPADLEAAVRKGGFVTPGDTCYLHTPKFIGHCIRPEFWGHTDFVADTTLPVASLHTPYFNPLVVILKFSWYEMQHARLGFRTLDRLECLIPLDPRFFDDAEVDTFMKQSTDVTQILWRLHDIVRHFGGAANAKKAVHEKKRFLWARLIDWDRVQDQMDAGEISYLPLVDSWRDGERAKQLFPDICTGASLHGTSPYQDVCFAPSP